jgi:hypothetical protein
MTQKHRAKCNGTAGTIRETSGQKEQYINLALDSVDRACRQWLLARPEYRDTAQWRKK